MTNYNPELLQTKLRLLEMLNDEYELLDTASADDRPCILDRINKIEDLLAGLNLF